MASPSGICGDLPIILAHKKLIPKEILKDSVLAPRAAAYFNITRRMEQETRCSLTRGFVLGNRYRSVLIQQRRAIDAKLRRRLSPRQFSTLIRQLEVLSSLDF